MASVSVSPNHRVGPNSLDVGKLKPVISPHQDVFSRFISGSGAPYWVLEAFGLNPRRVHQTGAAVLHNLWQSDSDGGVEGRKAAEHGSAGEWPDSMLFPASGVNRAVHRVGPTKS